MTVILKVDKIVFNMRILRSFNLCGLIFFCAAVSCSYGDAWKRCACCVLVFFPLDLTWQDFLSLFVFLINFRPLPIRIFKSSNFSSFHLKVEGAATFSLMESHGTFNVIMNASVNQVLALNKRIVILITSLAILLSAVLMCVILANAILNLFLLIVILLNL